MNDFKYSGNELDVFEQANKWKQYWADMVRPHMGNQILEVGSGIGSTTVVLKEVKYKRWVCLEPDNGLCQKIEEKKRSGILPHQIEVKNTILSEISDSEQFDTILYIDVLEHIEDDFTELEMAASLLCDKGKIIVLSPAHNFLFTAFDKKIGHFRRYNRKTLTKLRPLNTTLTEIKYLDSIGFFASLGNKLILNSAEPTQSQIVFWDRAMVPISKLIDPAISYSAGKSILAIFEKVDG